MLVFAGVGFAFATVVAAFFTAFWIALVGLPVALLMGQRIARPMAMPIALLTGTAAALILSYAIGNPLDFDRFEDKFDPQWTALILGYALPAAYLYHRFGKAAYIGATPD